MKYLHLSTGDVRGAFTGAYRLHENLKLAGHESKMFVRMKDSNDQNVLSTPKSTQLAAKVISKLFCSLLMRFYSKLNEFHRRYFFPYWGVVNLMHLYSNITFKPDLIIVYYVADFLSAQDLYEIQKHYKSPMVFYLMDAGMLTGGCHYPWDCTGYVEQCGNCPIFLWPDSNDWSHRIWHKRKAAFSKMEYSLIAGSSWLHKLCKKSSLHTSRRIDRVLMGIDSSVYAPRNKTASRKELGITEASDSSIIIYFGAQQLEDARKGFTYLFTALELMQSQLSEDLKNNVMILTVGAQKPVSLASLKIKNHHIEYLHDKSAFAKTYNAADIYVCPSVEDAGPMMINEAMMSGTPVIAFGMGVAEDFIIDGETGFIAENFDSKDLASKILALVTMSAADRARMAIKCREFALNICSQQTQVDKIVSITMDLMNNNA